MSSTFITRFQRVADDCIKGNPSAQFKLPRIMKHYLAAIVKGMSVNDAIDRATHDLYGNNGHPKLQQRWPLAKVEFDAPA